MQSSRYANWALYGILFDDFLGYKTFRLFHFPLCKYYGYLFYGYLIRFSAFRGMLPPWHCPYSLKFDSFSNEFCWYSYGSELKMNFSSVCFPLISDYPKALDFRLSSSSLFGYHHMIKCYTYRITPFYTSSPNYRAMAGPSLPS